MSEQPVSTPYLATSHCHLCGGGIEFDARDFQTGETRGVECPHCHERTVIGIERPIPKQFSDFIGQNRIKARLELANAAAKQRGETLGHVLLIGSPGSGKATLAHIIAKEMGANLKSTNGMEIEKAGDLAGVLTNLEDNEVLFIDEIDRLQKTVAEHLQLAMKDFRLHISIDQGQTPAESG